MADAQEHNSMARQAWQRLKAVAQGLSAGEATRTACRLSKWADPTHVQWTQVNNEVTKDMIKQIWPCPEGEIKKGRWKVARCQNDDIRANAERIFLEVYGHPLHNADAPLYFAKMLFMQFVLRRPVDFGSKSVNVNTHDIREETVTFTRADCALMVEGAGLELAQAKEILTTKLAASEQEATRLSQIQTPPNRDRTVETQLRQLSQNVQSISDRLNPTRQGNHISHFLIHPELAGVNDVASSSSSNQCPHCYKVFDGWSGHYMLPCGHYYHLVCLIRQMQNVSKCGICGVDINQGLYAMFGMASEYKNSGTQETTPSVLQNLQDEQ